MREPAATSARVVRAHRQPAACDRLAARPKSWGRSRYGERPASRNDGTPNFGRSILNCIEADFCNQSLSCKCFQDLQYFHKHDVSLKCIFGYFSRLSSFWDSNFCNFVIQSVHHEKNLFKTFSGQETMHRRRDRPTASPQQGLEERWKMCKVHSARFVRVRTAETQKRTSLRIWRIEATRTQRTKTTVVWLGP